MQLKPLALLTAIAGLFAPAVLADEHVSIPAALLGPWHSSFDTNGLIKCHDAKSQFAGVLFEKPNRIFALNGSFSCEVDLLQYDSMYSGQEDIISRWWFETTCISSATEDLNSGQRRSWHEYGYWTVRYSDSLMLEISGSDERSGSFWESPTGRYFVMSYNRCKN